MKKSIQIIAIAFAILLGNVGFSQNDTMYVNYVGNVTIAIPTSQIDSLTFYRPNTTPTITDADGNVYTSVTIGAQEWMAKNLRTTKYSDGTAIPNVTGTSQWTNLSTGAWSHYNNDNQYEATYGKLYNWYSVNTGKLCPQDWSVPSSNTNWATLIDYLGGTNVAGGKLKQTGTTLWNSPNTGATNESGFTALPSGNYDSSHEFMGKYGYFWSNSSIGGNVSLSLGTSRVEAKIMGVVNNVPTLDPNKDSGFIVANVWDLFWEKHIS